MADKLVIIDGNSLFYRSFYALPLLTNANGEFSNAVYGFAIQITKIINDIKPSHIVVAFDAGKHTFRNDLYSEYKATRKPMPTELRSQIKPLKEMLSLMNIKMCEQTGVEGDDIVGTIAKRFSNIETVIVTADRDTLQLIDDTTKVLFTKKGTSEVYIVDKEVLKRDFGVTPSQIVDLKAIQGDKSDNIPGVAGIGEKGAHLLIEKFESLDGIYQNLNQITGKQKEHLINHKQEAYLSYQLAKIKTDVNIDCNLQECKYIYPYTQEVQQFFKQYDFKTLLRKPEYFALNNDIPQPAKFKLIAINSAESLKNIVVLHKNTSQIAFFEDRNIIYFSNGTEEYVVDTTSNFYSENKNEVYDIIKKILEGDAEKILFDSKYVKHYLADKNIKLNGKVFDVSIAKHLVDGVSVKSASDILIDEQDWQNPASVIFNLKDEYVKRLHELGMDYLYYQIELPLVDVLFDMEQTGVKLDISVMNDLSIKFKEELTELEKQIYLLTGQEFNINSPKQLAEILYDKLGLKGGRKKSTSADHLEALVNKHPAIELILRYRKIAKLNSTYIEGFKVHLDKDNRVHTCFKQTLTNTGRLSSTEPNLQNIPIRSEDGKIVRSMFVASSQDHVLIDADYSQIELRLLAHMSDDEYFISAFNNNEDIHTHTASQVYGIDSSLVTKDMRRIAKVVNFGIIYGISEYGLSTDLNISSKEAKQLITEFYNNHPKVKMFMENAINVARETGRVSTLLGRSRKMAEISSSNYMVRSMAERASQNMPLQGSAADIVKIAMVKVYNKLKELNLKAKLILQVHDELLVDCPKQEESIVKAIVKDCMEQSYKLKVPLTVDVTSSYRWSDGH